MKKTQRFILKTIMESYGWKWSRYFFDAVAAVDAITASNNDEKLVETRTVYFAKLNSSSRFERINKLDRDDLYCQILSLVCTPPPPPVTTELPCDIVFIPSMRKRVQRWRLSWIRFIHRKFFKVIVVPFFFDSNLKLRKLSESPRNQSKTSQKKTRKKRKRRRRRRRKLKKRRQSNPSLPVSLCWRKSRKKVKARLRKKKKKKKKKQRHKSSHPPSQKSLRDQVCLVLSVLLSRAEEYFVV